MTKCLYLINENLFPSIGYHSSVSLLIFADIPSSSSRLQAIPLFKAYWLRTSIWGMIWTAILNVLWLWLETRSPACKASMLATTPTAHTNLYFLSLIPSVFSFSFPRLGSVWIPPAYDSSFAEFRSMWPRDYGVELKIRRSGVRFSLSVMCRSVRQTSHSIYTASAHPAVMGTWWNENWEWQ